MQSLSLLLSLVLSFNAKALASSDSQCEPTYYGIQNYTLWFSKHLSGHPASLQTGTELNMDVYAVHGETTTKAVHCSADPHDGEAYCYQDSTTVNGLSIWVGPLQNDISKFTMHASWPCDEDTYLSHTDISIKPLSCVEEDNGTMVGTKCSGPAQDLRFRPQDISD